MKDKQGKKDPIITEKAKRAIDSIVTAIEVEKVSNYRPVKKLITGIIMFASAWAACIMLTQNDNMWRLEKWINAHLSFLPDWLNDVLTPIACMFIAGLILTWFVRGFYRIKTFHMYNVTFDEAAPMTLKELVHAIVNVDTTNRNSSLSNIDAVLSYRESKMSSLNPEKAAELLMRTSILDAAKNDLLPGRKSREAASYLNSKLASMNVDKGLDYMTHK